MDFFNSCMREFSLLLRRCKPLNVNDERSALAKVFIPLLKIFSVWSSNVSFVWCEKKLPNTNNIWLIDVKYKKSNIKTHLLDEIGSLPCHDIPILVMESSGYNTTEDVEHKLDDSLKNLKSGTDWIKDIILRYKRASFTTMEKVKVYTIRIIQLKITLLEHLIAKDTKKRRSVECCSAQVPMKFDEILKYVAIMEMLSFLKQEIQAQTIILKKLEKEHLGLSPVDDDDAIGKLLSLC
ncbi:hypothetical protein CLU79DRAFT_728014 [Phycomyces nitens]|nr:hypothetical protein CLU79DRAFT_728014 [Phycomyces nitens]